MDVTNIKRLDYAIERTFEKAQKLGNLEESKDNFIRILLKDGAIPHLFTRDNNARFFTDDIDTDIILMEIFKYILRAKALGEKLPYNDELLSTYPFFSYNLLGILEYAAIKEDNLKSIVEFFIKNRYDRKSTYYKAKTDEEDIYNITKEEMKRVDEIYLQLKKISEAV
ncbi:MAG: hypothetical protein PHD02_04030 [Bacilli bacterium]|nr:hypothetical protein [Bacilli bacterium]